MKIIVDYNLPHNGNAEAYYVVNKMVSLVNKSYLHPWIKERAMSIILPYAPDPSIQDDACLNFVISNIQYASDPPEIETLSDPVTFIEDRLRKNLDVSGDCANSATYLATLLKCLGHRPRFYLAQPSGETFYTHVLVACHKYLDTTLGGNLPDNIIKAATVTI